MATLTTDWQNLGSASWSGISGATLILQGKYSKQTTENNITQTQFRVVTGGTTRWRTSTGSANFTGAYTDSKSIATYPNYVNVGSTILSIDKPISHNEDGTKSFKLGAYGIMTLNDGNHSFTIQQANITLPKIDRYPMITNAPNFNDEENPIIQYSTALGFEGATVEAGIFDSTGNTNYVSYRIVNVSNGSYTFNLTTSERNALRNATPNSNTMEVQFKLRTTTTDSQTFFSTSNKQLTIINANPTATYTELETNAKVSAILGTTASTIIQNASIVKYTITPALTKGAGSITNVVVKNNNLPYNATLSSGTYIANVPIQANTLQIIVTDSRQNSTTINVTKTMVTYNSVDLLQFSFERVNSTSSDIKLNMTDAKYYQTNFGNTVNVPVVKYKLADGAYVTIPSTNYVIDNVNHTISISNYTISNVLSYQNQGTFTLSLEDLLTSDRDTRVVTKGVATFEAGEHDFQINGDLLVGDEDRDNIVNVLGEINNAKYFPNTYSTSEVLVGKYNGNDLYRKVLTVSGAGSISLSSLNINLGFIDLSHSIINVTFGSTTVRNVPLIEISTSSFASQIGAYFDSNYSNVVIETGTNVTINSGYLVIEYTKSI